MTQLGQLSELSITSQHSVGSKASFSTTATTRTLRSGTTRRTQRTYQSSKTVICVDEPPRPCCGVALDRHRVRWIDEKLYGGRSVLGVPRTSRDGGFFLIIDDEGYLQLHGRTPFGWEPERYTEEHPDPFAEELDLRAEYFHCTRRVRTYEYSDLPHSHACGVLEPSRDVVLVAHARNRVAGTSWSPAATTRSSSPATPTRACIAFSTGARSTSLPQ